MATETTRLTLTQTEAAEAVGVTTQTIRNWERRKLIAGNRVAGGVKLYAVADLMRLAGKEVAGGQPVQQ